MATRQAQAAQRALGCGHAARGLCRNEEPQQLRVGGVAGGEIPSAVMLDHADTYGYHRDLHLQAEKSMRMMIAGLCTDPSFIANLPSEATPYPPEQ